MVTRSASRSSGVGRPRPSVASNNGSGPRLSVRSIQSLGSMAASTAVADDDGGSYGRARYRFATTSDNRLFAWTGGGSFAEFDPVHKKPIRTFDGHTDLITVLCAFGSRYICSGSKDRSVRVHDLQSADKRTAPTRITHDGPVFALCFDSNGALFTGGGGRWVAQWDLSTRRVLREFELLHCPPGTTCHALAHCQALLCCGLSTGSIQIFESNTGQLCHHVSHGQMIHALAFHEPSSTLYSGSTNSSVYKWDPMSGRRTGEIKLRNAHSEVWMLRVDATHILFAGNETLSEVAVVDALTGIEINNLRRRSEARFGPFASFINALALTDKPYTFTAPQLVRGASTGNLREVRAQFMASSTAMAATANSVSVQQRRAEVRQGIYLASLYGNLDTVKFLAEQIPEPLAALDPRSDAQGRSPVWAAASGGHLDVIKYFGELLRQGDLNAPCEDTLRSTPLMAAVARGRVEVVQRLLQHGAHINHRTTIGTTALWMACHIGHFEIVRLLIEAGASLECAHLYTRQSPLFVAIRNHHAGVVDLLLANGASLHTSHPSIATGVVSSCIIVGQEITVERLCDTSPEDVLEFLRALARRDAACLADKWGISLSSWNLSASGTISSMASPVMPNASQNSFPSFSHRYLAPPSPAPVAPVSSLDWSELVARLAPGPNGPHSLPHEFLSDYDKISSLLYQFVDLRSLDLSGLGITELDWRLSRLSHLETLNLANNELVTLPFSFAMLRNLKVLNLEGNRRLVDFLQGGILAVQTALTQIAAELDPADSSVNTQVDLYTGGAAAIAQSASIMRMGRVVMIGYGHVGKSTLRLAFSNKSTKGPFGSSSPESTREAMVTSEVFDHEGYLFSMMLRFIDLPGQLVYHPYLQQFFTTKDAVVVITFRVDVMPSDIENGGLHSVKEWLVYLSTHWSSEDERILFVVGTRRDRGPYRNLDTAGMCAYIIEEAEKVNVPLQRQRIAFVDARDAKDVQASVWNEIKRQTFQAHCDTVSTQLVRAIQVLDQLRQLRPASVPPLLNEKEMDALLCQLVPNPELTGAVAALRTELEKRCEIMRPTETGEVCYDPCWLSRHLSVFVQYPDHVEATKELRRASEILWAEHRPAKRPSLVMRALLKVRARLFKRSTRVSPSSRATVFSERAVLGAISATLTQSERERPHLARTILELTSQVGAVFLHPQGLFLPALAESLDLVDIRDVVLEGNRAFTTGISLRSSYGGLLRGYASVSRTLSQAVSATAPQSGLVYYRNGLQFDVERQRGFVFVPSSGGEVLLLGQGPTRAAARQMMWELAARFERARRHVWQRVPFEQRVIDTDAFLTSGNLQSAGDGIPSIAWADKTAQMWPPEVELPESAAHGISAEVGPSGEVKAMVSWRVQTMSAFSVVELSGRLFRKDNARLFLQTEVPADAAEHQTGHSLLTFWTRAAGEYQVSLFLNEGGADLTAMFEDSPVQYDGSGRERALPSMAVTLSPESVRPVLLPVRQLPEADLVRQPPWERTGLQDGVLLRQVPASRLGVFQNLFSSSLNRHWAGLGRDVRESGDYKGFKVRAVWHVTNSALWKQYDDSFRAMRDGSQIHRVPVETDEASYGIPTGVRLDWNVNESYCFHGTSYDRVGRIVREGFNAAEANPNGDFGAAIYFAVNSSKADQYATSKEGRFRLIICRVLRGHVYMTKSYRKGDHAVPSGYHSVDSSHFTTFLRVYPYREIAVYNVAHVYPEFVVDYERV